MRGTANVPDMPPEGWQALARAPCLPAAPAATPEAPAANGKGSAKTERKAMEVVALTLEKWLAPAPLVETLQRYGERLALGRRRGALTSPAPVAARAPALALTRGHLCR